MLRPSDAHLWVPCPLAGNMLVTGHYQTTTPAPDVAEPWDSDSRREGTCAHWVAEQCIMDDELTPADLIGTAHVNGWVVDDEMAWHVQNYLNYVRSFGQPLAAEMPVQLFDLVSGRLDTVSMGTVDTVRIFEFKYGWQIAHAEENWTLLCYALAAVGWRGARIEMHIYQPRPQHPDGPARVWTIEDDDFASWWEWLRERAQACFDDPQGKPGRHCRNCPAAGNCHALAENVYAMHQTIQDNRMVNHTAVALAAELRFLEMAARLLKAKKSAIEAEAFARITRGEYVPGWTVGPKKGNRRFTVPPEVRQLATGIDPFKPVEKSPAELEREGVPRAVIDHLAEAPTVGRALMSNPENLAKRIFGK
jgi:hypothetical protein